MRLIMNNSTVVSPSAVALPERFIPQAHQWVQLRDRLSEYSADQALLLCEVESDQWIAWVPNLGQVMLGRDQIVQAT
jgi:hypothetical protein